MNKPDTSESEEDKALLLSACQAALAGGKRIMEIYTSDFEVEYKKDDSPVTLADKKGQEIISLMLKDHFPGIPFLGEESFNIPFDIRKEWDRFWLVDPLDGTKEFINRNGEFTVNIALIQKGVPVLGVVYIPVEDTVYSGLLSRGAWMREEASSGGQTLDFFTRKPLPCYTNRKMPGIVVSRSHRHPEVEEFIHQVKKRYGDAELMSSGSSRKLCLIASGEADLYPRFAPTMEWDTAAGDGVCRAAGAFVLDYETRRPLLYNKENLLNPRFIAVNEKMYRGFIEQEGGK